MDSSEDSDSSQDEQDYKSVQDDSKLSQPDKVGHMKEVHSNSELNHQENEEFDDESEDEERILMTKSKTGRAEESICFVCSQAPSVFRSKKLFPTYFSFQQILIELA